jgi:membrane fusion protein, multidrug efflux system
MNSPDAVFPQVLEAGENEPPLVTHQYRRSALRKGLWALALFLLLLGIGALSRVAVNFAHSRELVALAESERERSVTVVSPQPGNAARTLALPATLRGSTEASLYARTGGYVGVWHKTIGDAVSKGELLAVIEAPELQQELAQARAARDQIKAKLGLASSSAARWEALKGRDAVSQQEVDEKRSAVQQATADFAAAQANVRRLEQLDSFRRIVAPFSGRVIRRNVDVGALVSAGNSGAGRELFALAQTDPLRLVVAVPQSYVTAVKAGQDVGIAVPDQPGLKITGKVARLAGAIDSTTRSMQVEIQVPNPKGQLIPGAYAQVSIPLSSSGEALLVPPNALIFGSEGPRVATVGGDGRVAIKPVVLGRDFGKSVEVLSGVSVKDRVVANPADGLQAGEQVRVAAPRPAKAAG